MSDCEWMTPELEELWADWCKRGVIVDSPRTSVLRWSDITGVPFDGMDDEPST